MFYLIKNIIFVAHRPYQYGQSDGNVKSDIQTDGSDSTIGYKRCNAKEWKVKTRAFKDLSNAIFSTIRTQIDMKHIWSLLVAFNNARKNKNKAEKAKREVLFTSHTHTFLSSVPLSLLCEVYATSWFPFMNYSSSSVFLFCAYLQDRLFLKSLAHYLCSVYFPHLKLSTSHVSFSSFRCHMLATSGIFPFRQHEYTSNMDLVFEVLRKIAVVEP
ncbi:hypothetical protein EDC96DRAFT_562296 [Choanephora cucurbitarum]|nr:hypothetical protein EDC96DRAFT_562296 [Choanephora cucurbitarum]